MKAIRKDKPGARSLWIGVVLAFLILISAWTTFIIIAVDHQPDLVEVEVP